MTAGQLFDAIYDGDKDYLERLLAEADAAIWLDVRDRSGLTPLAFAVSLPRTDAALVERLLRAGCSVHASVEQFGQTLSILSLAISSGDPATVRALLDAGADLHYSHDEHGALLNAVHGRNVRADGRLLELLTLLIARGARLDDVSSYGESAVRVLSRWGRFDAVALLLDAGASDAPLQWTPLMRAVAWGSPTDITTALAHESDPEARDSWSRTAWHIAVLSGDVTRTEALRAGGIDTAAIGHCSRRSLHYAVDSGSVAMLNFVLAQGVELDAVDQFDRTALFHAAEAGNLALVRALVEAGSSSDATRAGADPEKLLEGFAPEILSFVPKTPIPPIALLADVEDPQVAAYLLDRGADPAGLSFPARRGLLGLPPEPDSRLLRSSADDYAAQRYRRFGKKNPEPMNAPFWLSMIRSGVTAYEAAAKLGQGDDAQHAPVWCARRFGQSLTFLPDGRKVQIGGEHEDSYDPDFCIYNDVFVHAPDGDIRIYGYAESVFPPTDFHTATLIGSLIYVVGSLNYVGNRKAGFTPVYALDTRTFAIRRVDAQGEMPGWIYSHRTFLYNDSVLLIRGGTIASRAGDEEIHEANPHEYQLDLSTLIWRRTA